MSNSALHRADRVGFMASVLCAIHCAVLPLLLGVLPAIGLNSAGLEGFDEAFVIFASVLGATTVTMGWRRHKVVYAGYVLLLGLILLWVGAFTHVHDYPIVHAVMMTLGGLSVAGAHFFNMRLTHAHTHACGCKPFKEDMEVTESGVHADAC